MKTVKEIFGDLKPRNPGRIDRICELLKVVWREQPDSRLGQLLVNLTRSNELFYVEDQLIEELLHESLSKRDSNESKSRSKKSYSKKRYSKKSLESFFREVARLTSKHDTLGDSAVVYPSKLGKALAKVDPYWWQ